MKRQKGSKMNNSTSENSLIARGLRSDAWAATRADVLEVDTANRMYPIYADHAEGAYIVDANGKKYLDMTMGYGPVVLGHAERRVNDAVIEQLSRGICTSPMWSARQVELTELLVDVIPGAEMAYLMRTGSDATSAAIRLARIFTGRTRVAKWGYNGWHDWTAPRTEGIPESVLEDTIYFRYNDVESIEQAFRTHSGEIACLIMMSYGLEAPDRNFLEQAKEIAHRHGSLFIIDEMRSGFRIALGGAQEHFGVQADLSTFSKAMANGFAISAVVGREDVLSELRKTHMSSTFFGNAAEMAAAITTISILRDESVIPHLWSLGHQLQQGMRSIMRETGLPAVVTGLPVSPFLQFEEANEEYKKRFYEKTLNAGVLFHPNHEWFMSASHTETDVEMALEVTLAAAKGAV